MMRCPTCNAQNPDGAPFCAECGTRLTQAPGAQAQITADPASDPPPTGELPPETVLQDRYVIMGRLGRGGMGAVYRASDRRISTAQWAIKEMSSSALSSPAERARAREAFLQEAEMLAQLSHPNLPRVIDFFEQNDRVYLVMELVPGETLLSLIQREGLPQPLSRVLNWMDQLCDVLGYLHQQQPPIIFRDLKPANIMITPSGQIKLIDFGIARIFKPGQAQDTQAFGTIGYSAPEQYGRGQTDARSDVYSLAVLLHQLLTAHDPTTSPFRLPLAHQLNPNVPIAVSAAIAAATDSDPARRYPSVQAFREALDSGTTPVPEATPRAATDPYVYAPATPRHAAYDAALPAPAEPAQALYPADRTTGLANGSRWVGIVSLALMSLALLIVLVDLLNGGETGALGGLGLLLGFGPLVAGPIALVMGLVALLQPRTSTTAYGRRHATIGFASGAVTLLLCCITVVIVGSAGS